MKAKLLSLLLLPCLSACSVIMAAHSDKEPDLSVLRQGASREEVERELNMSIARDQDPRGSTVTYQFFTGDKPNLKRAAVYGVLDVVTLGIAELATTPLEAVQGDKHLIEVRYDLNNRLRSVKHSTEKAPIAEPEKLIGLDNEENRPSVSEASSPAPVLPPEQTSL